MVGEEGGERRDNVGAEQNIGKQQNNPARSVHTATYRPTLSTISSNNYHKLEDIKLDHFALVAQ